jgi:hypothetical protein
MQYFSQINPDQGFRNWFIPEILQVRSGIFMDPDLASLELHRRTHR